MIKFEKVAKRTKKDAKEEKKKLLMFSLQITPDRVGHSDSYKKFFKDYRKWTKHLSEFDMETRFIWDHSE
jgi:hypothetical protein